MNKRRNFIKKTLVATLGVAGLATASAARGRNGSGSGGGRNSGSTTGITEAQKETIFYMYQEEKVARDVYITLGEMYPNENTFASIQLSEQRHIDSVERLCDKYGIDKAGVNEGEIGNFVLPELQSLYNECVADGSENLLAALKVGEEIEITDIKDLEEAAVGMPSDVVNVFSSLREGSLNHLESFRRAISRTTV